MFSVLHLSSLFLFLFFFFLFFFLYIFAFFFPFVFLLFLLSISLYLGEVVKLLVTHILSPVGNCYLQGGVGIRGRVARRETREVNHIDYAYSKSAPSGYIIMITPKSLFIYFKYSCRQVSMHTWQCLYVCVCACEGDRERMRAKKEKIHHRRCETEKLEDYVILRHT